MSRDRETQALMDATENNVNHNPQAAVAYATLAVARELERLNDNIEGLEWEVHSIVEELSLGGS